MLLRWLFCDLRNHVFLGHMDSILNEGPYMYFVLEGSSSSAIQSEHHASAPVGGLAHVISVAVEDGDAFSCTVKECQS